MKLDIARKLEASGEGLNIVKRPLKKPFGTQTDGDLWGAWWTLLLNRGSSTTLLHSNSTCFMTTMGVTATTTTAAMLEMHGNGWNDVLRNMVRGRD